MRALIFASLALNIAVLLPVCYGIVSGAGWVQSAYGPDSAARGILLSVYAAILFCSLGLMVRPIMPMVAALLLVQIIYKVMTPFSVGTVANPVVASNLGIAAFHCITLIAIWRGQHG